MDQYTKITKDWLENRYNSFDEDGVYISHQPLYGFRDSHCEPSHGMRYLITWRTLKILSHINFSSFLDVGGSEGYKANLVKEFFNVDVTNSDISEEACKRSKEIFNIKSQQADIHQLPFLNDEFDVVHCSETLEHVADKHKALMELIRVAKKAVIISVPHEQESLTKKNIESEVPHGHINSFSADSLSHLNSNQYQVVSFKILHPLVRFLCLCVDAIPRHSEISVLEIIIKAYNFFVPIFQKLFGQRTLANLLKLDPWLCSLTPFHDGLIFVILKHTTSLNPKEIRQITPEEIINFKIPYYKKA